MQCNIDPCNLAPCNITFRSDVTGLVIYQCTNWALGSNHGGPISITRIFDGKDQIFGRLSLEDNRNGVTNYYKTFWKNAVGDMWTNVRAEVTVNSSLEFPRESVSICLGTDMDNMTNRPNDSSFGSFTDTIAEVAPGVSIPIWIRQNITAGGMDAARGQDVEIQIMLVNVD